MRLRRFPTLTLSRGKRRLASPQILAGLALALAGAPLGGCSAVIPLPSLVTSDDVTGSIGKSVSPLSPALDVEDWRRAKAALAVALDPQGNGAAVAWENPQSGAKGSFTPVGEARPSDDKLCRAFLADVGGAAPTQSLQGVACREKAGEWAIGDVKPWKKA